MQWNPVPHIQHAWDDMQTAWGKLALILFYTFIWAGILSNLWAVIYPLSQGGECLMENTGMDRKRSSEEMFKATTRSLHLFVLGFLMYADAGGMTIKNTTMVFLFMLANSFISWNIRHEARKCNVLHAIYVIPAWVFLAWTLLAIEMKRSDRGTARERESLNV